MNKKIVVLGGGTGLSALLRGIKWIEDIDITAIVTVADSGGSTGILSKHFDIPAVGDLRRVIASLSRNRTQLEESMEYRISETNSDLDGHTIGNLILISQIMMRKSFAKGIQAATKMLNVFGSIVPVSNEFNHLNAELIDGTIVEGEDKIGHSTKSIKKVFYKEGVASPEAVNAILEADYIIFGIGSLYTSLIANLIYPEIKDALRNATAKIIYFANVFTQHGETDDMSLKDHISAIEKHTYKKIIDSVVVSNTKISHEILRAYEENDKQHLLKQDYPDILKFDLIEVVKNSKTGKMDAKHSYSKIESAVRRLIK